MDIKKLSLLSATLLSFTIGTVGCATGQQFDATLMQTKQILPGGNQTAIQSTTPGQPGSRQIVRLASLDNKSQSATSFTTPVSPVSYHRTIQPTSTTPAVASLSTLGPNDNLAQMIEQSSGTVLVDFYADWCGPCRNQGRILHEMEGTASQNSASIIKVNIDQHRSLANAFNVTRLPTLMLIKNGQIIERQTGVASHQRVAEFLSR